MEEEVRDHPPQEGVNRVKGTFDISYWVLKLVGSSRSSRQ